MLNLKAKHICYKKMEEEAQDPEKVSTDNKWLAGKKLSDFNVKSEPVFNSIAIQKAEFN